MKEKQRILIVDDAEMNREILRVILEEDYELFDAANGQEAIDMIEQREKGIDLILLDVMMPVMDGFDVLKIMNERGWIEDIPVIMISAEDAPGYIARGYDMGVTDYIRRPYDQNMVQKRIQNTLMLYTKQKKLQSLVSEQIMEKQKNNRLMIDILSTIVEFRNGESGLHVVRVRAILEILLAAYLEMHPELQISLEEQMMMSDAAALHDIGKIVIPEQILNKPGRLTPEEFEIMKTHSLSGAQMLEGLPIGSQEKLIQYAYAICRWHHERWNGKGYSDGLVGNEIPLEAQIVALADVYDALVSERVYKAAYSHEKAVEMILGGECGEFNPDVLECLRRVEPTLSEEIQRHISREQERHNMMKLSEELLKSRLEAAGK